MFLRQKGGMIVLLLFLLCCYRPAKAQGIRAFARVSLNKRSVYAQQPIRATVTVYTATWFTQPLAFDNIQIPNAFIIPFTRTVPGIFHINGEQYAGLEFYYLIYPYKPGTYELPVIHITAETPPVGGYQGTRVVLKTQSLKYTVKNIPAAHRGENWFVAKGVSLREHWNKSLSAIKVGDVIERTIQIHARGALPNFIPELKPNAPDGASIYPNDPQLIDQRDDNDVNGTRIEKLTYLFEKEGQVTIPSIEVRWWDPIRQRMSARHTKPVTVKVKPNPNLGILASARDSLKAQQMVPPGEKAKEPFLIFGMTWKKLIRAILISLAVLWIVVKLIRVCWRWIGAKRKAYHASEKYWFHQFIRSSNHPGEIIGRFYAWWDRLVNLPPSFKESEIDNDILNQWLEIEKTWTNNEQQTLHAAEFKKQISKLRRKVKDNDIQLQETDVRQTAWP